MINQPEQCPVGFGLVEMAISTNPKLTIYRNLYENTGPEYYHDYTTKEYIIYKQAVGPGLLNRKLDFVSSNLSV